MRIQLIAEASKKIERVFKIWGLSILIDDDILFDTFSDEDILKRNLRKYNIDIRKIKYIIISHEHWDHIGGLWWILENTSGVNVYICAGSSDQFKKKITGYSACVTEVGDSVRIRDNIYSTGEMEAHYRGNILYEQSLLIEQNDSQALITGCSHPGIVEILKRARSLFNDGIEMIVGGFHLHDKPRDDIDHTIDTISSLCDIKKIAPLHCTGRRAVRSFKRKTGKAFLKLKIGDSLVSDSKENSWNKEKATVRNRPL